MSEPASAEIDTPTPTSAPEPGRNAESRSQQHTSTSNQPAIDRGKSNMAKAGERRTKKGKRKASATGQPPPLGPDDFVRVVPVPKRTEILQEGWRPVSLSKLDKAVQIELDESQKRATSSKGYRMVRATHGACEGTWYYEATISHLGPSGHVRLGWSTRQGELQAPVGYDAYSFAYRDIEGVKVHAALREEYGEPFQEGDVIGCFLHLGEGGRPFEKERSDIVTWKGSLYFRDEPQIDKPQALKKSMVAFTKNGRLQGVAYRDINEGTYYPALSIYTLPSQTEGASVTIELGPQFQFPPPRIEDCPQAQPASKLSGTCPDGSSVGDGSTAPVAVAPSTQA